MVVRSEFYILDADKNAVPVSSLEEWARWLEQGGDEIRQQIADDKGGKVQVSTIFLGLDHNRSGKGPPLLFETMIFGGPHDGHQRRCSTWKQAARQHAAAVKLAGLMK